MEEKKEKGNFWLTVATFIVNKRKAFLVLFAIACIYCAACMNKVSVNQDITKYLPADSETRIGLTLMDEQFMTYGSARIMVSNITWQDADAIAARFEKIREKIPELDRLLNENTEGWDTTRMGKVELAVLRLGAYELRYDDDIPNGVAINEAIEIAKKYGQESSGGFVNAILAKIMKSGE